MRALCYRFKDLHVVIQSAHQCRSERLGLQQTCAIDHFVRLYRSVLLLERRLKIFFEKNTLKLIGHINFYLSASVESP